MKDKLKREISNCWMTVNRSCNLKCNWCYAKETLYSKNQINIADAYAIIELMLNSGIKNLTLIGGEPTCYSNIFDIIQYAHKRNFYVRLVTNGVLLSELSYIKDLKKSGLDYIGLSLKGYSKENYIDVAGTDNYEKVMKSIKNISNLRIPYSVSMVLSIDNIENYVLGIRDAFENGARRFSLSFCYDFSFVENKPNLATIKTKTPFCLIDKFIESYKTLNEVTNGMFKIHQIFPLCIWDNEFIRLLEKRGQITTICQLLTQSGLIFDTDLSIIPCNALFKYPIGTYKKDFCTPDELVRFWNSNDITDFYDKLRAIPSEKCLDCNSYEKCGGGCISQWFIYSLEELLKLKEDYYAKI